MRHEHDFRPWANRLFLYCPCGATLDPFEAQEDVVTASKPRANRRRKSPTQAELPLSVQVELDEAQRILHDAASKINDGGTEEEVAAAIERLEQYVAGIEEVPAGRIPEDEEDDAVGRGTGL